MSYRPLLVAAIVLLAVALPLTQSLRNRSTPASPPVLRFADRTPGTPLERFTGAVGGSDQWSVLEQNGQGLALLDGDGDGDLDIFIPRGAATLEAALTDTVYPDGYFENLGGWRFADRTAESGVVAPGWSTGATAADCDGDGDTDLLVTAFGLSRLYANDGQGHFLDVTTAVGLVIDGYASSAAFFDADLDGDLDLYVCRYVKFDPLQVPRAETDGKACLYRGVLTGCGPWVWEPDTDLFFLNQGQGTFVDASTAWGVTEAGAFRSLSVVPLDLEGDGDLDLAVGTDVMPNMLLENMGTRFTACAADRGFALDGEGKHESSMGVAVLDLGDDADPDIFCVNFWDQTHTLYENVSGRLTDVSARLVKGSFGRESLSWGTAVADFDADGDQDLAVASGHIYPQVDELNDPHDRYRQDLRVWARTANGGLEEAAMVGAPAASYRGLAGGDLDGDGDTDLVAVRHGEAPILLENLTPRPGSVRHIRLVGRAPNTDAIGARVRRLSEADFGEAEHASWVLPHQGYQSSQDPRVEIVGTGKVEVRWPDGNVEEFGAGPETKLLRQGSGVRAK